VKPTLQTRHLSPRSFKNSTSTWPLPCVARDSGTAGQRRMSTCDRFELIRAGGFLFAMGCRIPATAILPRRTAHDPLEGCTEGAFGFVAERQGDDGNGIDGIHRLSPARSIRQHVRYSMGDVPAFSLNLRAKIDRDMPARSASSCNVQRCAGSLCMEFIAAPICLSARAKSYPTPLFRPSARCSCRA
jgi:hypothetical protein